SLQSQLIMPEIGVAVKWLLKSKPAANYRRGGSAAALPLSTWPLLLATIGIVDHDNVELSNHASPDSSHTESAIGTPKAVSAAEQCRQLRPGAETAQTTWPTRYLINDACVLAGKAAGIRRCSRSFEEATSGDVQSTARRAVLPRCCTGPASTETVVSSREGGVLGLALEAVKVILQPVQAKANLSATGTDEQQPPQAPKNSLRLFNALESSLRCVAIRKRSPGCEVCGREPRIVDVPLR
uniref:Secreted protein n=1 Tax=Macrostomum lignano TaxID=282301 RepID=A0A1I8FA44_9PLAT